MSGHSKWSTIKRKKALVDAKRGKVFTKLIREITVAARMGGGDVADNPRLRAVVDKALAANMTKDTIERAISRGAGDDESANMEEITYEGYSSGGVAVLVETLTDNVNRTVSDVRHAFGKHGGNLGTSGSVAYLFTKRGEIWFSPETNEEQVMTVALEAGAEDVESGEQEPLLVVTGTAEFSDVCDAFKRAGMVFEDADINMHPATEVELDAATAEKAQNLIDALEDLDDVQNVYTNASWPDNDG